MISWIRFYSRRSLWDVGDDVGDAAPLVPLILDVLFMVSFRLSELTEQCLPFLYLCDYTNVPLPVPLRTFRHFVRRKQNAQKTRELWARDQKGSKKAKLSALKIDGHSNSCRN